VTSCVLNRSSPNEQRFTDPDPSPLDDPAPMADSSLEYVLVVGDREEEEVCPINNLSIINTDLHRLSLQPVVSSGRRVRPGR